MDNSTENSITLERKIFFTKLKTHPLFLIKHIRTLFSVVRSRATKGSNRKIHPYWLADITSLSPNLQIDPTQVLMRIPEIYYQLPEGANKLKTIKTIEDKEDYYATNRFKGLAGHYPMPNHITDFINEPPLKSDPSWDTYSTCERVANLLLWIANIPKSQRVFTNTSAIVSFIHDSMHWVFQNLEYYELNTSNHILNNARVLIMAGAVLNDKVAIKAGLHIFKNMLAVLIQPQGSLRERSSHYQLLILSWLLDAYYFLPAAKQTFLKDYIIRITNVASLLCDEQGKLQALIGDISPDCSPTETQNRLKFYDEFFPIAVDKYTQDDWHVVQNETNKIILNYPIGTYPKNYPMHAHNDITSFVWLYMNSPILVDSGRVRYSKEPIAIRQKSAIGHNVALVNGIAPVCESLVINGHWCPAPYANATLSMRRPSQNSILLCHNGYARNSPVTQHQREISIHDAGIVVSDTFLGDGTVNIVLLWHLDPSFQHLSKNTFSFTNGKCELLINVPPRIKKGWCSTEYGSIAANIILVTKWEVKLPFTTTVCFEIKPCVV